MLMLANPAKALTVKSAPAIQKMTVVSTYQFAELATPKLAQTSNSIVDQLGCNCGNCLSDKLQILQTKLPSVGL